MLDAILLRLLLLWRCARCYYARWRARCVDVMIIDTLMSDDISADDDSPPAMLLCRRVTYLCRVLRVMPSAPLLFRAATPLRRAVDVYALFHHQHLPRSRRY